MFWLIMPLLGTVNGLFRQFVLIDYVNENVAYPISAFTLIVLLTLYVGVVWHKLNIQNGKSAWKTGLTWMLLTIFFEFSLGHFVSHLTWEQMFADYNIFNGRLWPLVLLSLLILPPLYLRSRRMRQTEHVVN